MECATMPQPLVWPDHSLDRNELAKQVMTAHTMVALSRGGGRNPGIPKGEWDRYEALSAGVPVDDRQKFGIWLEGTEKFFRLLRADKDCRPWLADAHRIA